MRVQNIIMADIDLSINEHYEPETLLEHPKTVTRRSLFAHFEI
ncbi:MAG: hypothetical protein ACUZ77_04520 [Candidatus Brocadiales bacterium]